MCSDIPTAIRDADMFGYNYNLNFGPIKGSYVTKLGGFFSLIIYLIMYQQFFSKTYDLVTYKKDTIKENETKTNF